MLAGRLRLTLAPVLPPPSAFATRHLSSPTAIVNRTHPAEPSGQSDGVKSPSTPMAHALCCLLATLVLLLSGSAPAQASLLHLAGPVPTDLGLQNGHLAPCPAPAHCAREVWPVSDPQEALAGLLPAVLALEGVDLVDTGEDYIHATVTSRLFGFVDDLELHADPRAGVIEVRSASRLGDSDLGVNGRRISTLKAALPVS